MGFSIALLALIIAVARMDARRMIIPDHLSAALALLGLTAALQTDIHLPGCRLLVACAVAIGFEAFRATFRLWRGFDGMGFGDVKLIAASVLWVGYEGLSSIILISTTTALASAASLRLFRGRLRRLPFGPHLAAALWIVWCWGPLVSL